MCILFYQLANDRVVELPVGVRVALIERGWLDIEEVPDWDGHHVCAITEAGTACAELNGADWGLDFMPVEAG